MRSLVTDRPQREADVVSDLDVSSAQGAAPRDVAPLQSAEDVIARAQRLIDSPRPVGGYPLARHVEALNVGDLTAIAIASLRESKPRSVP